MTISLSKQTINRLEAELVTVQRVKIRPPEAMAFAFIAAKIYLFKLVV